MPQQEPNKVKYNFIFFLYMKIYPNLLQGEHTILIKKYIKNKI